MRPQSLRTLPNKMGSLVRRISLADPTWRLAKPHSLLSERQALVEAFHECTGKGVVGAPQARHNGFRASRQEGFSQIGDALLSLQFAHSRVACRERRQVGV